MKMNGQQSSSPSSSQTAGQNIDLHRHTGHFSEAVFSHLHPSDGQSSCMITSSHTPKYLNHTTNSNSIFNQDHNSLYNTSPVHPLYYNSQHHFNDYDMSNNYNNDCSRNAIGNYNVHQDTRNLLSHSAHGLSSNDAFAVSMREFQSHTHRNYEQYIHGKNNNIVSNASNNNNESHTQNMNRSHTSNNIVCEPASVASNYSLEDDDDTKSFVHPYAHQTPIPGSPPIGYNHQMYNCCGSLTMTGQNTVTQSPESENDTLYSPLNDQNAMQCGNDKRVFLPHTPPTTPASSSGCNQINQVTKRSMNNAHSCQTSVTAQMCQQFDPKTGKLKVLKKRGRPRKCDKLNMMSSNTLISSNAMNTYKECDPYTFNAAGELQRAGNSQFETNQLSTPNPGKRPRGRPRLNDPNRPQNRPKNMPTIASLIPMPGQPVVKRGRGRPKSIKTIIKEAEAIAADALATSGDIPRELVQFLDHQKRLLHEQQQQKLCENSRENLCGIKAHLPEINKNKCLSTNQDRPVDSVDSELSCTKLPRFSSITNKQAHEANQNVVSRKFTGYQATSTETEATITMSNNNNKPFQKLAPIQTLNPLLKPLRMNTSDSKTTNQSVSASSSCSSSSSSSSSDDEDDNKNNNHHNDNNDDNDNEDTTSSSTNSTNSDCDSGSDLDSDDSDNSDSDSDTRGSISQTTNISSSKKYYKADNENDNGTQNNNNGNNNGNSNNNEQNQQNNTTTTIIPTTSTTGQKRICNNDHESSCIYLEDCICNTTDKPLPKLVLKRLAPTIDSYSVTLVNSGDNSIGGISIDNNSPDDDNHDNDSSGSVERQTIELLEMLVKKTSQQLLQAQYCCLESSKNSSFGLKNNENSIKT